MMHGRIWVDSTPGEGSTFIFTAHFGTASETTLPRERRLPAGLRVLVVDDNPVNRRILVGQLTRWNATPIVATGGEEALGILVELASQDRRVDLILLDAQMPGMDGFELSRQIAARADLGGATIMMLTSSGQYEDASLCEELGIAACLTKPIAATDLYAAICTVLDSNPEPELKATTTSEPAAPPVRPRRVLLAEDNIVNQRVAVGLLSRRGHHVTVVANGQDAVDAVAREHFDIVLMDLQMPVMGGLEATRIIRERERETASKHLRIVAMTAHAMTGDRDRCFEGGMDGYLSKPTEASTLYAEVEGSTSTAAAPGVGDTDLIARLHGDSELGAEVVRLFIDECPAALEGIRHAIDRRDAPAVRHAAHSLKGAAATAGAVAIADEAATLETLAADGNIEALNSVWARMAAEAAALLKTRAPNHRDNNLLCKP